MNSNMISNEGLAIEIKNLSVQITDLRSALALQANSYLSKEVFELRMKELDTKHTQLELEIEKVRKEARKSTWRTHTLTAIFTATLVMLISYVFNDVIAR